MASYAGLKKNGAENLPMQDTHTHTHTCTRAHAGTAHGQGLEVNMSVKRPEARTCARHVVHDTLSTHRRTGAGLRHRKYARERACAPKNELKRQRGPW